MDAALIVDGVVATVWRDKTVDQVVEKLPTGEHDLIEVEANGGPNGGPVICGQLWDGEALSNPPLPPPSRRTIPKSTVTARLIALGQAATVKAALDADPVAWARWFTPDWPNVFADDEGLLAFLTGPLALTEEQVATITA